MIAWIGYTRRTHNSGNWDGGTTCTTSGYEDYDYEPYRWVTYSPSFYREFLQNPRKPWLIFCNSIDQLQFKNHLKITVPKPRNVSVVNSFPSLKLSVSRRMSFCKSGHLPKRIRKIRKNRKELK